MEKMGVLQKVWCDRGGITGIKDRKLEKLRRMCALARERSPGTGKLAAEYTSLRLTCYVKKLIEEKKIAFPKKNPGAD